MQRGVEMNLHAISMRFSLCIYVFDLDLRVVLIVNFTVLGFICGCNNATNVLFML